MSSERKEFNLDDVLVGSEKRRIESLFDPIRFDELFTFANSLLASKTIEKNPHSESLSVEARIVEQLGTRGVRAAYEILNGIENWTTETDDNEPTENTVEYAHTRDLKRNTAIPLVADSEMRYPEVFSGSLDREAINRATQLGEVMMEDMFKILGQDAYAMVEKMKHATSDEEQFTILNWLHDRIDILTNTYKDEANGDLLEVYRNNPADLTKGFMYHPTRISGKIIGTYPDHRLSPTCLGVSIAAAGFMHHAGMPTLHAGVMKDRVTQRIDNIYQFCLSAPTVTKELYGLELPDKFRQRIEEGVEKFSAKIMADAGYHHCVLVKLQSGKWAQFDPNYNATLDMFLNSTNENIDTTYSFLNEMQTISPGLEVTQKLESFQTLSTVFEEIIVAINPDAIPSKEIISDYLSTVDPLEESLPAKLFELTAAYAFDPANILTERAQDMLGVAQQKIALRTKDPISQFYTHFVAVTEPYLLDGMQLDDYIRRCQSDVHFLERAVDDLRSTPFMIMLSSSINYLHNEEYYWKTHPVLEVGLPATRIGLAALNDTAQFYDISPSPTFWLSNWPSLIPITESFYSNETSTPQINIMRNNLTQLLARNLRYSGSYGKLLDIQSTLQTENEQENQDGS